MNLNAEKQEISAHIEALNDAIRELNKYLQPVRARLKSIRRQIIQTHHHQRQDPRIGDDIWITGFCAAGAPARADLFAEQDNLRWAHAPQLRRSTQLNNELAALEKALARILQLISKQPPPEPERQGRLL